jgi:LDH2 family malate/lactate/ureidoglycolate dehydrogenase
MFGSPDVIRARVDEFIDAIKASGTRDGVAEILYPGEKSQRLQQQRRKGDLFELPRSHYENFCALAREHDVAVPSCR